MGFMGSLNERKCGAAPRSKEMLRASSAMPRCRWLWEGDPIHALPPCAPVPGLGGHGYSLGQGQRWDPSYGNWWGGKRSEALLCSEHCDLSERTPSWGSRNLSAGARGVTGCRGWERRHPQRQPAQQLPAQAAKHVFAFAPAETCPRVYRGKVWMQMWEQRATAARSAAAPRGCRPSAPCTQAQGPAAPMGAAEAPLR